MNKDPLLAIIAEWLDEDIPSLIPRSQYAIDPETLDRILAIVGPRRAGKTYFMYQLIRSPADTCDPGLLGLAKRNEKRELAGIVEAVSSLNLASGVILTYAQEEEREVSGVKVSVLPV